jgi:hypothetical protein
MDELTEFLGSVAVYTPEDEFVIIQRALAIPFDKWDDVQIQTTRNRYIRYVRNINFGENKKLENDIEYFIDMTTSRREYNEYDTFALARKIDLEIYKVVLQSQT